MSLSASCCVRPTSQQFYSVATILFLSFSFFVVQPSVVFAVDCNGNGIEDVMDVDPADPDGDGSVSLDCNANGVPDECDASLTFETKILASDAAANDEFGQSVAVDGDTVVVGARFDGDAGNWSGSVYVFGWSGTDWIEEVKLTADDAAGGDLFGHSVAISGDTIVIGALEDDDFGVNSGSAYVFVRSGGIWEQQAKLTAADAAAGDLFGSSVSISGDSAVVGARFDDDVGENSGSAYIYLRTGDSWGQQQKVIADDGAAFDNFGDSVSIDADTVVIGSIEDDNVEVDAGSAYVFVRSEGVWTQQDKLIADDAFVSDRFGISVSISGDSAVIGSWKNDGAGPNSGAAYVFVRSDDTWMQEEKLTATDATGGEEFGVSVSISGNRALIGSWKDGDSGPDSGSAYLFVRTDSEWAQTTKLTATDAFADDEFGFPVALDNDTIIIGARQNDDGGDNAGSAYIYDPANDCNRDGIPDDCQLDANDCNGDSIPDDCQLEANDCDANMILDDCEADQDDDGVIDACDNCPMVRNPSQTDSDGDTLGDICDNCPSVANLDQADSNFDDVGDVCPCPMRGDMNDDGNVDGLDIQLFVEKLLS